MVIHKELILNSEYEEVERVETLLNELQDEIGFDDELYAKLMLTVTEAATNGIVHGNKLDATKTVSINATVSNNKLIVTTKDMGSGFVPDNVPNPLAEENLLKPSGRGVFFMKEYADEVEYSESGTKLKLVFKLS